MNEDTSLPPASGLLPLVIPFTAHHAEMSAPAPSDPPQLTAARRVLADVVGQWASGVQRIGCVGLFPSDGACGGMGWTGGVGAGVTVGIRCWGVEVCVGRLSFLLPLNPEATSICIFELGDMAPI